MDNRILGIFGSPRKGGNTDLLLEEFLQGAREEGWEVERLRPSDLAITPCTECLGCFKEGRCVIDDDMQAVYGRLLDARAVALASPIFFYGVTAWSKALIDRCQALWARRYVLRDPALGPQGMKRRGFFLSVCGTKGKRAFEGAALTVRYFFDSFNAGYEGELFFRSIDAKGDILAEPAHLLRARRAGAAFARGEEIL